MQRQRLQIPSLLFSNSQWQLCLPLLKWFPKFSQLNFPQFHHSVAIPGYVISSTAILGVYFLLASLNSVLFSFAVVFSYHTLTSSLKRTEGGWKQLQLLIGEQWAVSNSPENLFRSVGHMFDPSKIEFSCLRQPLGWRWNGSISNVIFLRGKSRPFIPL